MKKFQFSLETVLSYRQQILESLQTEHAIIIAEVNNQQAFLQRLKEEYAAYSAEYRERSANGLPINDIMVYQSGFRAREREIQAETLRLTSLKEKEEAKRAEVVKGKQDTSSIEKLREKKLNSYNEAVAKSEEQFIEEFVSSRARVAV